MNYVSLGLRFLGFPSSLSEHAAVRAQSKTTFSWQCLNFVLKSRQNNRAIEDLLNNRFYIRVYIRLKEFWSLRTKDVAWKNVESDLWFKVTNLSE